MAKNTGGSGKVGQPCTVTSGPNAGKKGTYTSDDGGSLWCEGDWGGTECGSGKCSDAQRRNPTVKDYTDTSGRDVFEVEGDFRDNTGKPFHGRVVVDASSFKAVSALFEPLAPSKVGELDLGSPELARAITSALNDAKDGAKS